MAILAAHQVAIWLKRCISVDGDPGSEHSAARGQSHVGQQHRERMLDYLECVWVVSLLADFPVCTRFAWCDFFSILLYYYSKINVKKKICHNLKMWVDRLPPAAAPSEWLLSPALSRRFLAATNCLFAVTGQIWLMAARHCLAAADSMCRLSKTKWATEVVFKAQRSSRCETERM